VVSGAKTSAHPLLKGKGFRVSGARISRRPSRKGKGSLV